MPEQFDGTAIFFLEAKRLMKQFNLQSFKQTHPILFKSILGAMKIVYDSQQERLDAYVLKTKEALDKIVDNRDKVYKNYDERIENLQSTIKSMEEQIRILKEERSNSEFANPHNGDE